jgi:hypothetical protein
MFEAVTASSSAAASNMEPSLWKMPSSLTSSRHAGNRRIAISPVSRLSELLWPNATNLDSIHARLVSEDQTPGHNISIVIYSAVP